GISPFGLTELGNTEAPSQGFGGALTETASAARQEPGCGVAMEFSGIRLAGLKQGNASHSENFSSWGHRDEPSSSFNMALPRVPPDGLLLRTSTGQSVMPTVVRGAEGVPDRLFDQVIQGVRLAQRAEAAEIHVRLRPDFLGRLSIRILANEDGMHIEIRAENVAVRQVMQDNFADLQQRLAQKGLAFSQFSILADTGWTPRREPGWPFEPPIPGLNPESETTTEVVVEPVPLTQSGSIDYLA
ncbi:MAG: flagellar hook-length control protein FliK, partial [Candidatus Hydrogenedentota bacterium]